LKIDVRGGEGGLSEALRGKVVRRVLLALSRFGPQVKSVTVSLTEPVNALGGVDQRCRMRAFLLKHDDIRAEAINGGFESAVARAVAQLASRVEVVLDGHGKHAAPSGARRDSAFGRRRRPRSR
jgi:hypothetical protein